MNEMVVIGYEITWMAAPLCEIASLIVREIEVAAQREWGKKLLFVAVEKKTNLAVWRLQNA